MKFVSLITAFTIFFISTSSHAARYETQDGTPILNPYLYSLESGAVIVVKMEDESPLPRYDIRESLDAAPNINDPYNGFDYQRDLNTRKFTVPRLSPLENSQARQALANLFDQRVRRTSQEQLEIARSNQTARTTDAIRRHIPKIAKKSLEFARLIGEQTKKTSQMMKHRISLTSQYQEIVKSNLPLKEKRALKNLIRVKMDSTQYRGKSAPLFNLVRHRYMQTNQKDLVAKESYAFLDMGASSYQIAKEAYRSGDGEKSDQALELSNTFLDIALGITPFVSMFKDAFEAYQGTNLVTGKELTSDERTLAVVGFAAGLVTGGTLGGAVKYLPKFFPYAKKVMPVAVDLLEVSYKMGLKGINQVKGFAGGLIHSARTLGLKAKEEITDFAGIMKKASQSGASRLHEPFDELTKKVAKGIGSKDGLSFVKGIPGLKYTGKGTWISEAGVVYGQGSKHFNRLKHILLHRMPDPSKKFHTIFQDSVKQIPKIIDEAWKIKGMPLPKDPAAYVVPMDRIIGQGGETSIKIIVKPGTSEIITAYPF